MDKVSRLMQPHCVCIVCVFAVMSEHIFFLKKAHPHWKINNSNMCVKWQKHLEKITGNE